MSLWHRTLEELTALNWSATDDPLQHIIMKQIVLNRHSNVFLHVWWTFLKLNQRVLLMDSQLFYPHRSHWNAPPSFWPLYSINLSHLSIFFLVKVFHTVLSPSLFTSPIHIIYIVHLCGKLGKNHYLQSSSTASMIPPIVFSLRFHEIMSVLISIAHYLPSIPLPPPLLFVFSIPPLPTISLRLLCPVPSLSYLPPAPPHLASVIASAPRGNNTTPILLMTGILQRHNTASLPYVPSFLSSPSSLCH